MRATILLILSCMLLLAACGGTPAGKQTASPSENATKPADTPTPPPPAPAAFEQTLELQGIKFLVSCPNSASLNTLTITPSGLEIDNKPIVREVNGTVRGAEVADLNADGSPEIYVYVNSVSSTANGSLVAYSANKKKSLSEIYLPPVSENSKAAAGYAGRDEFAVVENTFVQRFPIQPEGGGAAQPSAKTRQLQYKLRQGEAGWVLRLDRTVEY